jgi:hypothetical protein
MRKIIDNYLKYMWNTWSEDECKSLFGDRAEYIWLKWMSLCRTEGMIGAAAAFWADVDSGIQEELVNRANS